MTTEVKSECETMNKNMCIVCNNEEVMSENIACQYCYQDISAAHERIVELKKQHKMFDDAYQRLTDEKNRIKKERDEFEESFFRVRDEMSYEKHKNQAYIKELTFQTVKRDTTTANKERV